jgi:hypothetical protein
MDEGEERMASSWHAFSCRRLDFFTMIIVHLAQAQV